MEGHASSLVGSEAKPLRGRLKDSHQFQPLWGQGELHARPVSSPCSHSKRAISLVSSKASRLENPQQEKPSTTLHSRFQGENQPSGFCTRKLAAPGALRAAVPVTLLCSSVLQTLSEGEAGRVEPLP